MEEQKKPSESVEAVGGAGIRGRESAIEQKSQITEESAIAKAGGRIQENSIRGPKQSIT